MPVPDMTVVRMTTLTDEQKDRVRQIFIDSYYKEMKILSSEREHLLEGFNHVLIEEAIHVAMIGDEPVAMAGCSTNKKRSMVADKKDFLAYFGRVMGPFGVVCFKKEFETPLKISDDTLYFECVATAEAHRGKGIASEMLSELIRTLPYKTFSLDVYNTNERAKRVYDRLGFKETGRKKSLLGKFFLGYQENIWMSRPKSL